MSYKELLERCVKELEGLNGLVVKSENVDCNFDELINDIQKELMAKPQTIEDYFREWELLVNELSEKEIDLLNLNEQYAEQEQEILTNTDFKKIYGANNDKIRKNHLKKELKPLEDAKNDLDISTKYIKRRMDYIKNLMKMQGTLLQYGETL